MTTTRKLIKNFEDNTISLTHVEPTKSLLIDLPCTSETTYIINSTVKSMEKEDIGGVACRYLQSKRGERNTFYEIIFWGIVMIVIFASFLRSRDISPDEQSDAFNLDSPNFIFLLLMAIANILPNISNTLRYAENKNACDKWLKEKLNNDTYDEIRRLPNKRDSLFTLNKILKEKNIDTTVLERKGFGLSKKR